MNSILDQGVPVRLKDVPIEIQELLGTTRAGFPSPAEDLMERRIDLNEVLITHPKSTYVLGVRGTSMIEAGIHEGDLLVINRALKPRNNNIVVASMDGEYTVKYLHLLNGRVRLKAANPTFPDIVPREDQSLEIWGVVTASIKRFKY